MEAEVVTADGEVKIANACTNPDLFWALKGGGGGFGVVTRVTLRTHALPEFLGGVFATIKASSDEAYRRLIAKIIEFYAQALFNPHWGEQLRFGPGGVLSIFMVLQGLDQQEAEATWRPFFDWVSASAAGFHRRVGAEDHQRAGAPFLGPRLSQAGSGSCHRRRPSRRAGRQYLLGRQPRTRRARSGTPTNPPGCPSRCLQDNQRERLVDALFAAAKHRGVSLHFNKGLAGATADAIATARDTAMNPAVVDAFALAISGAGGPPAYPDVPGHEPDAARRAERG